MHARLAIVEHVLIVLNVKTIAVFKKLCSRAKSIPGHFINVQVFFSKLIINLIARGFAGM